MTPPRCRPDSMGGGISGPCPTKSLFVPSKHEICPPSEDCAPKESNMPGATGVHLGPAAPPKNTACASPSVSKVSFREEKHE